MRRIAASRSAGEIGARTSVMVFSWSMRSWCSKEAVSWWAFT